MFIMKIIPYVFISAMVVIIKLSVKMIMGYTITARHVLLSSIVALGLVILLAYIGFFDLFANPMGYVAAAGVAMFGQEVLMFYFAKYDWFFTGIAKHIQNWFKKT